LASDTLYAFEINQFPAVFFLEGTARAGILSFRLFLGKSARARNKEPKGRLMKADKYRRFDDPFRPSGNPAGCRRWGCPSAHPPPPRRRFVRNVCACGDNPDDKNLMPPAAGIKTDKAV